MELAIAHVDARMDRLADGDAAKAALFDAFCSTLLPAHRSKFVQFLVFHACAKDAAARVASVDKNHPRSYDEVLRFGGTLNHHASGGTNDAPFPGPTHGGGPFGAAPRASAPDETLTGSLAARVADALVARLTDPHHPPAGRLAAAAYLASFLARAAFLPPRSWPRPCGGSPIGARRRRRARGGAPGAGSTRSPRRFRRGAARGCGGASAPGASASGMGVAREQRPAHARVRVVVSDRRRERLPRELVRERERRGGARRCGSGPRKKVGRRIRRDYASGSGGRRGFGFGFGGGVGGDARDFRQRVPGADVRPVLPHGGRPAPRRRARGGGSARVPLRRVPYSRLQPTRACLPSVVSSLRRASEAGLDGFDAAFVRRALREREEAEDPRKGKGKDPKQQAPPGGASSLGGDVAEAVRRRRPLRMFFPFDPYLLRRSAALLRLHVTYAEWKGGTSANGTGRQAPADDDDLDLDMDGGASGSDGSRGLEPSDSSSDEASHGGAPTRARAARRRSARARGGTAPRSTPSGASPTRSTRGRGNSRGVCSGRSRCSAAAPSRGPGGKNPSRRGRPRAPARTPRGPRWNTPSAASRGSAGVRTRPRRSWGSGGRTEGSGSEAAARVGGTRVAVGRGRPRAPSRPGGRRSALAARRVPRRQRGGGG